MAFCSIAASSSSLLEISALAVDRPNHRRGTSCRSRLDTVQMEYLQVEAEEGGMAVGSSVFLNVVAGAPSISKCRFVV